MSLPDHDGGFDLQSARSVHVVGAGGAGMSAIATVLAAMGKQVSGSDLKDSAALRRLEAVGVTVHVGHRADHVGAVDAVAVSTAVASSNPEVVAARARHIPVLRRAEILRAVCRTRRTVAVAGTHGKTTTSSMLALVLVEADESDGTFVELGARDVIVTNVEPDHLDHRGGFPALTAAFERFVRDAPGVHVVGVDEPGGAALAQRTGAVTYGTAPSATWRMEGLETGRDGTRFRVLHDGADVAELVLAVPGVHNARNALAATAMAAELGAPVDAAERALARYAGVARRWQYRGEHAGITFVDDYAHLPSEVATAIDTGRRGGWPRVVAVFQPHRFSRTAALWASFADAFADADVVVVTSDGRWA